MKNLKTILFAVTALLLLSTNSFAQRGESSNCVHEGSIILDAYYGLPYVFGALIKDGHSNAVNDDKITNYNHLGGKVEYMINKLVGLGAEYTYARVTDTYTDSYNTVVNGQSVIKYGVFNESLIKQRFLLKVNFHFATTSSLDPYATAGFGYKVTKFSSDNPNVNTTDVSVFNVLPVAFRMGAGLRWFFTDNIGLAIEAGIGGPLIQGGLTAKF